MKQFLFDYAGHSAPRVLQICYGYGAPFLDVAAQYVRLFDGSPWRVTTVFLKGRADRSVAKATGSDEVVFLELGSSAARSLTRRAIGAVKRLSAARRADLVVAHRYKSVRIALAATEVPVLGVHHAFGDYRRRSRRLRVNRYKARLQLIGVSDAVRSDLRASLPRLAARVATLHNVIDADALASRMLDRDAARTELGLGAGPVIASVGRLHADKDQATLIEAFAQVAAELPCAQLVIIGTGALAGDLAALASRLGVASRVRFAGFVSDAARLFRAFDVFVLSSEREPFGRVLLEAMVAGVPTAVADSGGAPEVAGPTAEFFGVGDSHALAAAIRRLLALDTGERAGLAAQMAARVREHFGFDAAKRAFWSLALIEQALGSARRADGR